MLSCFSFSSENRGWWQKEKKLGYRRLSVDLYEHAPVVKNPLLFKSTKQRLGYILLRWDLSAEVRIKLKKRQQKHPYLRSLIYPMGCLSFVHRSLNSFTLTAEITPVSATSKPFHFKLVFFARQSTVRQDSINLTRSVHSIRFTKWDWQKNTHISLFLFSFCMSLSLLYIC